MQKTIIYGVIVESETTMIEKFETDYSIEQLRKNEDGILIELIELLAEKHESWNDVLKGTSEVDFYDGESVESIRITEEQNCLG